MRVGWVLTASPLKSSDLGSALSQLSKYLALTTNMTEEPKPSHRIKFHIKTTSASIDI
jgi:hypothetical protein